jgi:hypothetical protein
MLCSKLLAVGHRRRAMQTRRVKTHMYMQEAGTSPRAVPAWHFIPCKEVPPNHQKCPRALRGPGTGLPAQSRHSSQPSRLAKSAERQGLCGGPPAL